MNKPIFTGVCTAMVTPFLDKSVNYPMAEQLLRRQMDSGVTAVVVSGTTGEASTLSDEEKTELIYRYKAFSGDACKIIAGTGTNDTAHTIALSQAAEQAGADGLLIVSPYYNKSNTQGLYNHFSSIANAVSIPIILYNVPSRTGVDIPVSVYEKLSHIPNIVGVKEASADITKTLRILHQCPETFWVWSGNDDMTIPILSLGGQGVISVTSNICPKEVCAMCTAALDTAAYLQKNLQSLNELLFCEVNPIPVKAAMKLIGYDCGSCRMPLGQLSPEYWSSLKAILCQVLSK